MSPFRKPYGGGPKKERRFGDRGPSRPSGPREKSFEKFDAVCSNCGKACQVPFRPTGTRPVYCTDCFGGPHRISRDKGAKPFEPQKAPKSIADLERQIGAMNTKIDTMLRILEALPKAPISDEFGAPPADMSKKKISRSKP
jgi:CxxC-x17-CxxC domain-containing protein